MTPHPARTTETLPAGSHGTDETTPTGTDPSPEDSRPSRIPAFLHVGRRTHILLAQLMWTLIGSALLALGVWWVVNSSWGVQGLYYALPFLVLGMAKGLFILDRTARRTAERIDERGDDRFVLTFYSRRTWLIALGFMILGQVLRRLPIPRPDLGLIYVMVGVGLLLGSRAMWRSWWGYRHDHAHAGSEAPREGGPR